MELTKQYNALLHGRTMFVRANDKFEPRDPHKNILSSRVRFQAQSTVGGGGRFEPYELRNFGTDFHHYLCHDSREKKRRT